MKRFLLVSIVTFICSTLNAQTVSGKIVDQTTAGVPDLPLQLYVNTHVFTTTSAAGGSFRFDNVASVADEALPTGYAVADNYPNPFNPTTRFEITLPSGSVVSADIFNVLGEKVSSIAERYYHAGTNFLDVELNGNPNGFYIARISIGGKYSVVKKMMLVYGSRHLSSAHSGLGSAARLEKNTSGQAALDVTIDSLVAASPAIGRTVFKTFAPMNGAVINLGNLVITKPGPQPPTLSTPGNGASNQNTATTVSWNASAGAESYTLQISASDAFTNTIYNRNGIAALGLGVTGLSSTTDYYWRVNATNKYGTSRWSDTWKFTTRNNPPDIPLNPLPKDHSVGVSPLFSFLWRSGDFDGDTVTYDVYLGTDSNQTPLIASNLKDRMYQQDGLLSASTTYYWKVVAKDSKGLIANGPIWSFTTIDSSLYELQSLRVASFSDTAAVLTWSDYNYFEAGFLIECSADGINYSVVDSVGANSSTASVAGVYQDGVTYAFRIRAFSPFGKSPYSNVATAIKGAVEFGGLRTDEAVAGIATDASGNLYVSMLSSGSGNGIRKYVVDTDSGFAYAPSGGVTQWSGLKIGPGGILYGVRGMRALFKLPQNAPSVVIVQAVSPLWTDIDFDNFGNLWAVGNNANIYRIKLSDRSVKAYPFKALLRSVRVYNGYVYAAGRQDSTEGVWRFKLNAADSSIGTAEEFFNLSKQPEYAYGDPPANAITFNADGEMYLGTSAPNAILLVAADGKSYKPFYSGYIQPSITAFAWGKGTTLFAVTTNNNSRKTILKINTHKAGAPYYGAQ